MKKSFKYFLAIILFSVVVFAGVITGDSLRLRSNGYTTTINPNGSLGANYTLTLPSSDGTSGQVIQTNGAGVLTWTDQTGGSGSGGKNYYSDSDYTFETGVSLAVTFDDGASFVDGTGGTVNYITVEQEQAAPLEATGSLQINKSANDASGEGVAFASRSIDSADSGRNLFVTFEWDGNQANYTDGDLFLNAYSAGTDATILPVVPLAGLNSDGSLPKLKTRIVAYIPTSSNTDGVIRLALHLPSDSATGSAWALFLDDLKFGPESVVPGAIVTPWSAYTPSWTGASVNPAIGNGGLTGYYRRVGDSAEVRVEMNSGTTTTYGTGDWYFSLPSGLLIDTAKMYNGNRDTLGTALMRVTASNNEYVGIVRYNSTSTVYVSIEGGSVAGSSELNSTTPATFAASTANQIASLHFTVPISGWEASALVSTNDLGLQSVQAVYVASGSTANSSFADATYEIVDFDTKVIDTHNAVTTGASWKFTAPRSGRYLVTTAVSWSSSANLNDSQIYLYKNAGGEATLYDDTDATASGPYTLMANPYVVDLTKGDYIDIRARPDTSDSSARGLLTTDNRTRVSIVSLPDLTLYGAYAEKNKYWEKILSADVTTATTISDLTFSNLTIGKFYEYKIQGNFGTDTTDDEVFITISHNSATIGSVGTDNGGAATYNQVISTSGIFQAAATSLTFVSVSATANGVIYGNGTKGETWAQLTERNDLISGD